MFYSDTRMFEIYSSILFINDLDQSEHLSNCAPTSPPLTQQQLTDNNLRLMLG